MLNVGEAFFRFSKFEGRNIKERQRRKTTVLARVGLISENFLRLAHVGDDFDAERTALLACATFHAFARLVRQNGVMFAHRLGDDPLRLRKIQELRH